VIVGVSGDRAYRTHYKEGFRWLAGAGSAASDVNQKGQVAGYATVGGARRAMLWAQDGTATDLGVLPGQSSSEAVAISETGIVVGTSGASQGFIWSAAEGMKALPANFVPRDVNHWGEVAGAFENTGQCAVYYKGYGTIPLPMSVDWAVGCVATGINSWGDVVGYELQTGVHRLVRIPMVWTWAGNQYRYGF
jgi:probable HAF family extracellular repeat protein